MGNRGSRIPEGFWTTKTGRDLCTTMHGCAWDALDCLNAQIEAMTAASAATADETIKAEIDKAHAKVLAARAACREAMAILSDSTF